MKIQPKFLYKTCGCFLAKKYIIKGPDILMADIWQGIN